jgi:hypothetical protein
MTSEDRGAGEHITEDDGHARERHEQLRQRRQPARRHGHGAVVIRERDQRGSRALYAEIPCRRHTGRCRLEVAQAPAGQKWRDGLLGPVVAALIAVTTGSSAILCRSDRLTAQRPNHAGHLHRVGHERQRQRRRQLVPADAVVPVAQHASARGQEGLPEDEDGDRPVAQPHTSRVDRRRSIPRCPIGATPGPSGISRRGSIPVTRGFCCARWQSRSRRSRSDRPHARRPPSGRALQFRPR